MKKLSICFLLFFCTISAFAQIKTVDTLRLALLKAKQPDTNRLIALRDLSHYYIIQTMPDSALVLSQEGYELALKFNRRQDQAYLLKTIADAYGNLGDYVRCLSIYYKVKEIFHNTGDVVGEVNILNNISVVYYRKKQYVEALSFLDDGFKMYHDYKTLHPFKNYRAKLLGVVLYLNISEAYLHLNKIDSADYYSHLSYLLWQQSHAKDFAIISILHDFGNIAKLRGQKDTALFYLRKTVTLSIANRYIDNLSVTYLDMADLFHRYKQQDSAEYYGQKALLVAQAHKLLPDVFDASQALYTYFEQDHNLPMAYKYLKLSTAANDSLFSEEKLKQLTALDFDQKQKQRNVESEVERERNKVRLYFLIFGVISLSLLTFAFWREGRERAKTNRQLQKQQLELDLINQNLESMIYERTKDLEDKNEKLYKYSAYLSHQIRGPISTIKGLVNIQEEGLIDLRDFVKMISACVADIDSKIVEINEILHDEVK
jgi:hypothetical protein